MSDLSQHGNLNILQLKHDGREIKRRTRHQRWRNTRPVTAPHHHRLQHVNEGAVTAPLLQEGPANRLLLRLLHQQVQVTHVLHGAVQLGAQVPPACATQHPGGSGDMEEGVRRTEGRDRQDRTGGGNEGK